MTSKRQTITAEQKEAMREKAKELDANGWTRVAIAKELGISSPTLSRMINNKPRAYTPRSKAMVQTFVVPDSTPIASTSGSNVYLVIGQASAVTEVLRGLTK